MNVLSLFQLCPIEDFQSFCDEQQQKLQEFIGELTSVFQRAVREPFFPDKWIIMHLVQNRSVSGCGYWWAGVGVGIGGWVWVWALVGVGGVGVLQ